MSLLRNPRQPEQVEKQLSRVIFLSASVLEDQRN